MLMRYVLKGGVIATPRPRVPSFRRLHIRGLDIGGGPMVPTTKRLLSSPLTYIRFGIRIVSPRNDPSFLHSFRPKPTTQTPQQMRSTAGIKPL